MSHGFRLVAQEELPAEWQNRSMPAQLVQRARTLGLPEGQTCMEHVVFCLPQYDLTMEYADWVDSNRSLGSGVGFCVQSADTWRASARPGALARLRKSRLTEGYPGWECLCLGRVFSPVIKKGTCVAVGGQWGGDPGWIGAEQ